MKARTEEMLRRKGLAEREVKRGYGGIRDIEFAVQLLQLVHGRADLQVRAPATLDALEQLARGGYVSGDDAAQLSDAYVWIRTVEHRLQLVDEHQTHTIPEDIAARTHLARVPGSATHRAPRHSTSSRRRIVATRPSCGDPREALLRPAARHARRRRRAARGRGRRTASPRVRDIDQTRARCTS
jgi:glutamine synthetase adenylyltransferase